MTILMLDAGLCPWIWFRAQRKTADLAKCFEALTIQMVWGARERMAHLECSSLKNLAHIEGKREHCPSATRSISAVAACDSCGACRLVFSGSAAGRALARPGAPQPACLRDRAPRCTRTPWPFPGQSFQYRPASHSQYDQEVIVHPTHAAAHRSAPAAA
jgi:hypothetical protein